jgi:hypothetical protein
MNRWTLTVAGLALSAGLLLCISVLNVYAQQGASQPYPNYSPGQPASQPGNPFLPAAGTQGGYVPANSVGQTAQDGPALNADIAVKPSDGEWMICLIVYRGPKAHEMARQFVSVLRSKEYGLWAFVYDYSAEARKTQQAIRQEKIATIQKYYVLQGLKPPETTKIRMPKIDVQDEVAVLAGGYKDQETARKALKVMKEQLPIPDKNKVALEKYAAWDAVGPNKQDVEVNPFKRAFLARNPSLPKQMSTGPEWDIGVLRSLNADESYSLLRCPKKLTLMVREFRLPVFVESAGTANSPLKNNLSPSLTVDKDISLHNAHTLAGWLRQEAKLEAYALHDRTSSFVTIGAFDSLDDPKLHETQQRIASLHQAFVQKAAQTPGFEQIQILPIGVPMKVPH